MRAAAPPRRHVGTPGSATRLLRAGARPTRGPGRPQVRPLGPAPADQAPPRGWHRPGRQRPPGPPHPPVRGAVSLRVTGRRSSPSPRQSLPQSDSRPAWGQPLPAPASVGPPADARQVPLRPCGPRERGAREAGRGRWAPGLRHRGRRGRRRRGGAAQAEAAAPPRGRRRARRTSERPRAPPRVRARRRPRLPELAGSPARWRSVCACVVRDSVGLPRRGREVPP